MAKPVLTTERIAEITSGGAGAAGGLITSEFLAEFVARAAALTGAAKTGVKALLKGILFGIFYIISTITPGLAGLSFLIASFSALGSIAFDLFSLATAGGIQGLAERAAVRVRVATMGAEAARREIERMEAPTRKKEVETAMIR